MADLAPIDVALLPIWGWGPTIGEGHLDPERAATAATLLQARVVIPVHWGTYSPIGVTRPKWLERPVHQFADALRAVEMIDALRVLAPGESVAVALGRTSPADGPT
jgi:L-ascorbate metabolism protein UlaG (beta-lactamase superfamily)